MQSLSDILKRIFYFYKNKMDIILNSVRSNSKYYKKFSANVDKYDYDKVISHKWTVLVMKHTKYAQTMIDGKHIYLHRFIINPSKKQFIDHIDGDGLNCSRTNLRVCSHSENMRNQRIQKKANKVSKFKGVFFNSSGTKKKRWRVSIQKNSKRYSFGYYLTQEDAALRYNEEATKLFGKFVNLNII